MFVQAPMLVGNARAVHEAGEAVLPAEEAVADLSEVHEADSSALAVIFSWMRIQRARGGSLRVEGAPEGVRTLAEMYGVSDLVSIA